jgi:hypothetical protein
MSGLRVERFFDRPGARPELGRTQPVNVIARARSGAVRDLDARAKRGSSKPVEGLGVDDAWPCCSALDRRILLAHRTLDKFERSSGVLDWVCRATSKIMATSSKPPRTRKDPVKADSRKTSCTVKKTKAWVSLFECCE